MGSGSPVPFVLPSNQETSWPSPAATQRGCALQSRPSLGDADGDADGLTDGLADGLTLGDTLGLLDGLNEGEALGEMLGLELGDVEGAPVG